jgi:hypothetical protein
MVLLSAADYSYLPFLCMHPTRIFEMAVSREFYNTFKIKIHVERKKFRTKWWNSRSACQNGVLVFTVLTLRKMRFNLIHLFTTERPLSASLDCYHPQIFNEFWNLGGKYSRRIIVLVTKITPSEAENQINSLHIIKEKLQVTAYAFSGLFHWRSW